MTAACEAGEVQLSALCLASKGSPGGSRFFYLGCLGPAFECLEMLFSRCFLAHAGSVYKQLLKAKPVRAAGRRSWQRPHTAPLHPAMGSGAWGHFFLSLLEEPGWLTKAQNSSSSFLLPSSWPAASCPVASQRCRHLRLPSCPGSRCWGVGSRAPQSPGWGTLGLPEPPVTREIPAATGAWGGEMSPLHPTSSLVH